MVKAWICALLCLFSLPLRAELLDDVLSKGVLVAGVRDGYPPFGFLDAKRQYQGYEIDLVRAIARALKVRAQFLAVSTQNRFQILQNNYVDVVVAMTTRTPERQKGFDFSYTYFVSGQQFMARVGRIRQLSDLANVRIGVASNSTSYDNVVKLLPAARIVKYDDSTAATLALLQDEVDAVTTDGHILMSYHKTIPNPQDYEIPALTISREPYGVVVRKGNPRLVQAINQALLELERSGEGKRLYDKWFGPGTSYNLKRNFTFAP